ncbi:chromate efflux transporter [Pelagibacterium limicola]|uniref:chromate efflux transporter n=1 Tax=Pelagibacterium limicola TaxID=2791022 RepID=UPI0018AF738D|nr:chromate efflux transporter [Pelagibacterium limicola]
MSENGFPTLAQATRIWARIGFLSFGGPAGQIALMHRIIVEEKRWIGEQRFLNALNFCMLLPGPEAQQLAIYLGWLMHRTLGGIIAGVLFITPGFFAILALSYLYVVLGSVPVVEGLFFGLKAAVLAIVVQALIRIASRAVRNRVMIGIAAMAFVALAVFNIPFPIVVLGAGLIGYAGTRMGMTQFSGGGGHGGAKGEALADADSALGANLPAHARPNPGWAFKISAVLAALWLGPVALLVLVPGPENVFTQIALFFSQMAVVTFGGAYAVLAYVAQEAVQNYGWLAPGEMLDGLGMAETTPGPLIQVLQFVAFIGAWRDPGPLDPYLAATLAALLATWVTFTPCFLWIFLGAPFIERLRENAALSGALSAITAAVVGVIANLALWFGFHTLFAQQLALRLPWGELDLPVPQSLNLLALALALTAGIALFRFKIGVLPLILGTSAVGVALGLTGLV